MNLITAPEPLSIQGKSVFLAGSIEEDRASQWQNEIIKELKNINITILNPRRKKWNTAWKQDINNPHFKEQVEWELKALEEASCIVFYFDPKTKSPVTLLELGLFAKSKKIIVCCPDGYWRKGNVDIVCQKYNIPTTKNIKHLIHYIKELNNPKGMTPSNPR